MSATNDAVLSAIGDGAKSTGAICDATGFEPSTVHQATWQLKKSGAIAKGETGFELGDGVAPKSRTHEARAPADDAPPQSRKPKKTKRTKKANGGAAKPAKAITPRTNGHAKPNGAGQVEFTRFGEYVVMRRVDVVELLTIFERWRQMIESMA